jgi:hypothetical protein
MPFFFINNIRIFYAEKRLFLLFFAKSMILLLIILDSKISFAKCFFEKIKKNLEKLGLCEKEVEK